MIHGKKRNGDLFKRLTESWGYTKPETVEEEVTPLDEQMAQEEQEEVQEEGFMDTIRKAGRSVGGAVTGATAVRERLAGYLEEIKAALAGTGEFAGRAPQPTVRSGALGVKNEMGRVNPKLAAMADKLHDYVDQNFVRRGKDDMGDPEVKQNIAQMVAQLEDGLESFASGQKMEEGVFDANHYCIHHGGVHHNGSIEMAEAVQHVKPDANGHISHYDMKLEDGTILENVAAEDIQVTNASLAKEHQMKRDHDPMKDAPEEEEEGKQEEGMYKMKKEDDDEPPAVEEGGAAHKKDPRNRRGDDPRTRPMEEVEASAGEEVVEEAEEEDTLEEAIRRVVIEAISAIKANK